MIGGRLDEVEERRAVGAEQEQRDQPPQRAEQREHRPPEHQAATPRPRVRVSSQITPEREDRERGGGVDATDHGDRQRRQRGGPARRAAGRAPITSGSSTHGASALGQASIEIGPSDGEHPRRQREREAGQRCRPGRSAPRARGPAAPCPTNATHRTRATTAAGPPSRARPSSVAEREERAHRPQVAVGLVLELAERALRVPQVQRRGPGSAAGATARSNLVSGDEQPGDWTNARPDEQRRTRRRAAGGTCGRGHASPLAQHDHEVPRHHLPHAPGPAAASGSSAGCSAGAGRPRRPAVCGPGPAQAVARR